MFRSNSTKRPCEVFLITAVIFVFVSLIVLSKTGVAQIKGLLSASQKGAAILDFEDVKAGALPLEWKIEATNQKGPFATWQVIKDMSALSGEKVLALTSTNHNSSGTFNICWTDSVKFLNGEIEVSLKSVKGRDDQGGGLIWRVQDKDNYYVARFNPLEDNFRIYYVKGSSRKMLADAIVRLPSGEWHKMKIIHRGGQIQGFIDNNKLIDVTDSTITKPGGIGFWTKADAVTLFDDLAVRK